MHPFRISFSLAELPCLFHQFVEHVADVFPFEAHPGNPVLHQLSVAQGRQGAGNAIHRRLANALLRTFRCLQLLPVQLYLPGVGYAGIAKNVGMPAHQLAVDGGQHIGQGKVPRLPGDVGMEGDLDENIAQLFRQL